LAPEILERWPAYDVKCDVWSIGVILFLLLGGYLPFDDEDEDKVFDRTRNGHYDFRPQFWRNISNGAKDLVSQCLTINPLKRITATEALKHDWMAIGETELSTHQVDVNKLKSMIDAKKKMRAAVTTVCWKKVGRLEILLCLSHFVFLVLNESGSFINCFQSFH
jgi:serine/threonine protein kinase